MNDKKIAVLGSTGSIGCQTLEVIEESPHLRVDALSAHANVALLKQQIEQFKPKYVFVTEAAAFKDIKAHYGDRTHVFHDWSHFKSVLDNIDIVVGAISGAAGIQPTLAALEMGKTVALANKETMVAAGDLVRACLAQHHGCIIPVDSEHSAIYQCLEQGNRPETIILTASGGPFRTLPLEKFKDITLEDALAHPNWSMGQKITIDSATLMNKGLEVIEAHQLFQVPYEQIEVLVHPQSVVHSMVQFTDGSILAQLGCADMRLPIQYALNETERLPNSFKRLNLAEVATLTFEPPRWEAFPALRLAFDAGQAGGSMPAALNAANEIAVAAFLQRALHFTDIVAVVSAVLEQHHVVPIHDIQALSELDQQVRRETHAVIERRMRSC